MAFYPCFMYYGASSPQVGGSYHAVLWFNTTTGRLYRYNGSQWDPIAPAASGGGGAASWGGITGTLGDQSDLQTALAGKAASSHTHTGVYEPANANLQAHVAATHAPADAQKNSDITKAEIEAKLTGAITSHSHAAPSPFVVEAALASDVSTGANTTPVNVTGLVFTFEANAKYVVELFAIMQSPAATTGYGLQLDVSAAVTLAALTFFHQLANTGTLSGGSSIADDASAGVSSGVPTNATNVPLYASGVLITGANTGTAQLRLRSETTAVATMKANSILRVRKL